MKLYNTIIPNKYNLGGLEFKTIEVSSVEGNNLGEFSYTNQTISLAKRVNNEIVNLNIKESTFCHELVHSILSTMNENELNANEQFVDVFACFLYQYLKTAEK